MVTPSHLSQLRDARTHLTRACGACAAVRSASVYLAQLLDAYVPPSLLEPWMADSVIEAAPALTVAVECSVGLLMIVAAYARAPRCRACGLLLATALHVGIDLTPPPNRHASAHTCLHICCVASSQAFAARPPPPPPPHPHLAVSPRSATRRPFATSGSFPSARRVRSERQAPASSQSSLPTDLEREREREAPRASPAFG